MSMPDRTTGDPSADCLSGLSMTLPEIPRRHLPNRIVQQLCQSEPRQSHLPIHDPDFLLVIALIQIRSVPNPRRLSKPH